MTEPRPYPIALPLEAISELCRRHDIVRLALFGSVLRDDFGPESDVDILVEFEGGNTPGFDFFDIQYELEMLLHRKVDLLTPAMISRYFVDRVLAEARPIYDAA